MRLLSLTTLLFLSVASLGADRPKTRPDRPTRYYSSSGRLLGKTMPQGNVTKFYGPGGKLEMRTETRGREMRYYTPSGRYLGKRITR